MLIEDTMIGEIVLTYDSLDSTNSTAAELIRKGEVKEGTVVMAAFQKQGKGQTGNFWESEAGKNLLVSIVLLPGFLKPEKQFMLNKIIALAVAGFVQELLPGKEVKIKWPNDIYVGNKKIAGILINNVIQGNSLSSSVIGIGVNINQEEFKSAAPNPVSASQLMHKNFDLGQCLSGLCKAIECWYKKLQSGFYNSIDENYILKMYRFGTCASYRVSNKEVVAKITGVSVYGRLLLEDQQGKSYDFDLKEVEFVI